MEGLVINHQKRRKCIKAPNGYETDHIVPYCISMDDSQENLQFLKKEDHKKKSVIDRKIIKIFRNKGWMEKVTHYSIELKKPISFLIKEYKKEFDKLVGLVGLVGQYGVRFPYKDTKRNHSTNSTTSTNYT